LIMAIFVTLVGIAAGYSSILLFGALYVPAVLSTAFVIGPSQTFGLGSLDRQTRPPGVAVVPSRSHIGAGVGTTLATGIYGAVSASKRNAGNTEFDSLLSGFRGSVVLVVVTSLSGIILAFLAYRSKKSKAAQVSAAPADSAENTVASIMKSDVYALSSD